MNLQALDPAAVVFLAVLTTFMCLDEIVNPGIKPNGKWKILIGGGCSLLWACVTFLITRG